MPIGANHHPGCPSPGTLKLAFRDGLSASRNRGAGLILVLTLFAVMGSDARSNGLENVTHAFGLAIGQHLPRPSVLSSSGENEHTVRPPHPHTAFSFYLVKTTTKGSVFEIYAQGNAASRSMCELQAADIVRTYEQKYGVQFEGPSQYKSADSKGSWVRWTASSGTGPDPFSGWRSFVRRIWIGCDTGTRGDTTTIITYKITDDSIASHEALDAVRKNKDSF